MAGWMVEKRVNFVFLPILLNSQTGHKHITWRMPKRMAFILWNAISTAIKSGHATVFEDGIPSAGTDISDS
jgi:hypothetical protein